MTHLKAHTQEKNYKCDYCDQAFCDSSTLKKHKRTHTGKRQNKNDENRNSMHHDLLGNKGEKPFVCRVCNKSFAQSGNLRRHAAVHSKSVATATSAASIIDRRGEEQSRLETNLPAQEPRISNGCTQDEYAFLSAYQSPSYLQPSSQPYYLYNTYSNSDNGSYNFPH